MCRCGQSLRGPDNVRGRARGCINPRHLVYAEVGGETPQRLVNQFLKGFRGGNIDRLINRKWRYSPFEVVGEQVWNLTGIRG